ncbi:MAG TPA: glycoside hydrolase family 78 protein [Spongiibacteraceae bacterium]|nr:glycoside hydrolase family 78 protein [Spongiibacteraceae bacterium]
MKLRYLLILSFVWPLLAFADLSVNDLTADHLRDPLGIDNLQPLLSWKLQSNMPSTMQTAYEIRVAKEGQSSSLEWLSTGRIAGDESINIGYSGPALQSGRHYQWQVRVWDNHANVSDWSPSAHLEMGLLAHADWGPAQWITYPWSEDKNQSQPSPFFRKKFPIKNNVLRARLYITALGLYEASVNGQRVGDAYFTPGWTSYDKRLQYQVYDVTPLLRAGNNALGAILADGWYRGNLTWFNQRNLYGDQLALLAKLVVEYRDGSSEIIASDPSWQVSTAEIRSADIYNGELQDLRLRKMHWDEPGFSASDWGPVKIFADATPPLVASTAQPVRELEIVKPIKLLHGPNGESILDMGQNMVGWLRFKAKGQTGQQIRLFHAEVLDQNGALYRKALRSAQQQMEYILPDAQEHTLQPHFSFQGFRYVQVDNYPGALNLDDFEGVAVHSDLPALGHFETSNAMLNKLHSNIVWGQRGNFLDVPTDCPQRDERLGWTGDIQVFTNTAAFNMDSAAFLKKWLTDLAIDQTSGGAIPFVAPNALGRLKIKSLPTSVYALKPSATGWGDAITIVPWALYQQYGDSAALVEFYDNMKQWVEYERAGASSWWMTWLNYHNWFDTQRRRDDKYIWNGKFTFGDWLAPVPVSSAFVNTIYFANSAQLLSETARLLHKADDEKVYAQLARDIRAAFQRRFTTSPGLLEEDIQGAYVLALQYDMLDVQSRDKAARRLNELVQKNGNHLATGFLSTPHLLDALERFGYLNTAYAVLQQESFPSWLYPITKGATTIWERWGGIQPDGSFGDDGMNSFNHYAYGAVGEWMYGTIGGIRPLQPGYKKISIAPRPGGDLTSAKVSLQSPYGLIGVEWHYTGSALSMIIEIPSNTTAELVFPIAGASLQRDGKPLTVGDGIERISTNSENKAVLDMGSGNYAFSTN